MWTYQGATHFLRICAILCTRTATLRPRAVGEPRKYSAMSWCLRKVDETWGHHMSLAHFSTMNFEIWGETHGIQPSHHWLVTDKNHPKCQGSSSWNLQFNHLFITPLSSQRLRPLWVVNSSCTVFRSFCHGNDRWELIFFNHRNGRYGMLIPNFECFLGWIETVETTNQRCFLVDIPGTLYVFSHHFRW